MISTNCKIHPGRAAYVILVGGSGACEECYTQNRIRYNRKVLENIEAEVSKLNKEHAALEGKLAEIRSRYSAAS